MTRLHLLFALVLLLAAGPAVAAPIQIRAEAQGELIVLAEPDATFRPEDVVKLLVYSDHCDAVFGTRTQTCLEHGLEQMAAWVRRHGARQSGPFAGIEILRNLPAAWQL